MYGYRYQERDAREWMYADRCIDVSMGRCLDILIDSKIDV